MKFTFFLKNPKSEKPTLILFTCYFKLEKKKFVYSTGEKILPKQWDSKEKYLMGYGSNRPQHFGAISLQLNRYGEKFEEAQARCKKFKENFTSKLLREEFDTEFKRVRGESGFFKAYSDFMDFNIKQHKWSHNTIKRYNNIRNLLEEYEKLSGSSLTFHVINDRFLADFTSFSLDHKKHGTNTFRRNQGLFKTFMFFALEKGYTHNSAFQKFRKMPEAFTEKIALTANDLASIMATEYKDKKLERARDVFVFACTTGMRYGELKHIGKHNIKEGNIILKEEKGINKKPREIPLNLISERILKKYNYSLPLISNQKQNDYLKDVFEQAGFDDPVEKAIVKGKMVERETVPMYSQISTHTARRTFITMMKRKGKSDKLISKITGHSDLKTLNAYYQVDQEAKKEAVADVFDEVVQLRKVD